MRDRIGYILALAVLIIAIVALVVVSDQERITTGQEGSSGSMQSLFAAVSARINNDANFEVRIRIESVSDGAPITLSQAETRISEVGSDYFCLSNTGQGNVCYPYSRVFALAVPPS